MPEISFKLLIYLGGFAVIGIAAHQISKIFRDIKLPLITGLLIAGTISGPFILNLIPSEAIKELNFLNDFSLAFIAFAAGTELYLKELRSRVKSILWNTFGQLVVTFSLSSVAIYIMADIIPFMNEMSHTGKIAVAILAATIFVARSPSSAIAVINEMRARGPFTKTAMGVTVLKDVLVIILFAICFSLSGNLINGVPFSWMSFGILLIELVVAFSIGYGLGQFMTLILRLPLNEKVKTGLILLSGYSIYLFNHWFEVYSLENFNTKIHIEPLLVCIVASFTVTNFTKFHLEFQKLLHEVGPAIYVIFFTLTGATMLLDVLLDVWGIALILFSIRIMAMIIASYMGGFLAKDPIKFLNIGWMPYVTQAGVGLGLATEIAAEYPGWGVEFSTIIIAIIVLNQMVGPPLFKWSIDMVGEGHYKATRGEHAIRNVRIFGLEGQSLALAKQLMSQGWQASILTEMKNINEYENSGTKISQVADFSLDTLSNLKISSNERVVLMLSDEENYKICEFIFERVGTADLIVRLHDRANFEKFHQLGAIIVEPSTAMVSLLDHFVRSPNATSLLLGMEKGQDTIDLEVQNATLHGMYLRNLRFPSDVIILAIKRKGQTIISHGYTRLRLGDLVTMVGSPGSLEAVSLRFEEEHF